jgi:hypothetical protein
MNQKPMAGQMARVIKPNATAPRRFSLDMGRLKA